MEKSDKTTTQTYASHKKVWSYTVFEELERKYTQLDLHEAETMGYAEGIRDAGQDLYDRGYAQAISDLEDHVWNSAYWEGYRHAKEESASME